MASLSTAGDIFDNPSRYQTALEGFRVQVILQIVVFHAILSGIGWALGWWLPDTVAPAGGQYGAVVLALAVQVPIVVTCARMFAARRREAFWFVHSLMSLSFFVWLGLLVWAAPAFYGVILATLFAVWAYHDAWTAAGERIAGVYLAAPVAMDLALLGLDAGGGRGLIWAWQANRSHVLALFAVQIVLTVCVQWLIRWVGREVKEQDSRAAEHGRLERELVSMKKEREVIQTSCALLATGLVASKFSHDMASPVTVLRLGVDELRTVIGRLPEGVDRNTMLEVAGELEEVARQVVDMTGDFARAVREREALGPVDVEALCRAAWTSMIGTMRGHEGAVPPQSMVLAGAQVWTAPGHTSTLANLLTNSVLHAPDRPIDFIGEPAGAWFYRLSIRDRGVDGEARAAALERIQRLLSMTGVEAERGGATYRGYGVGLVLAKVYLLRYGGWLSVRAADEGPGLVFDLLLPSADPATIPAAEDRPENLAR